MNTRDRIIWLERLAHACRIHAYVGPATQLRLMADRLNATLPPAERVDAAGDECLQPVKTESISKLIEIVRRELAAR